MSSAARSAPSVREVAGCLLRIGVTAFGGPAAHIALMHDEIVRRRRWMDEQDFLDRVGVTNLIPGPNSTELAILVGRSLAGAAGLVLAGLAFIVPAVVIVLALAWAYVEFGDRPAVEALLYGIGPVLVAIVARALLSLGRRAVAGPLAIGVFGGALGLYLAGVDEIVILVAAGIATAGARGLGARFGHWTGVALASGSLWSQAGRAEVELDTLFLVFLKIGSVLYGSGYVLLAFLRTDLVEDLGWLSGEQLVDAVAIGQMTPGPLFSTATFAGYVAAGLPGAALATVGIFLPSFLLIALVAPLAARARSRGWAAAVLDGVNVGALGLMAGVTLELAIAAVVDVPAAALAAVAGVALLRYDVNPTWLIAGGAAAGAALSFR